jgi:hypothetical protein
MLDINRLREQFDGFNVYQAREQDLHVRKLNLAIEVLERCSSGWEELSHRVQQARVPWLRAELREAPVQTSSCRSRPTPMTVVATDGSQIYPDRHVEPTCYLLNISRIVFQYGTLERPLIESVPSFKYRQAELKDHVDFPVESATTDLISALRDEQELEQLFETAQAVQITGRPIAAVADGTLIRWMLAGIGNRDLEKRLIRSYVAILARFREAEIPVCSYISMPRATEVVNFLRLAQGEDVDTPTDVEESLAGLTDRHVFERILEVGERSATFQSASHNQQEYDEKDRICYFYVRVPSESGAGEIGRVEIPRWVADRPDLLDMIHALILSECEKGFGYPMILAEAHERAVIRAREKELFYRLIETEMLNAGLRYNGSRKQASKRRPVV